MRTVVLGSMGRQLPIILAHGLLAGTATSVLDDVMWDLRQRWSRAALDVNPPSSALISDNSDAPLDPFRVWIGPPPADHSADLVLPAWDSRYNATFSQAVTRALIERRPAGDLLLHAAAVGDERACVAFVASSGTGKTTLARSLARTCGYVTDETVAMTVDGTVLPHPKPLSVRHDGELLKSELSPGELGLQPTPALSRLGAVILPRRTGGADLAPASLTPVSAFDVCSEIILQTSGLIRSGRPIQLLLGALAQSGGPFELCYREADSCGEVVEELLAHVQPVPPNHAASTVAELVLPGDSASGVLERTPWVEAARERNGGRVLLAGADGVFRLLDGLGAAVWWHATAPSRADLENSVKEDLGDHPQASELIDQVSDQLRQAGVLRG